MIFRNTLTNVLHWDFVRTTLIQSLCILTTPPECTRPFHQFPCHRLSVSGYTPCRLNLNSNPSCRATGSININITEIQQLGELWDSSTLTTVHDRLSSPSKDANVGGISGNRMFFANDYMVQRGPGYITTVKMYSPRTKNTECLNDQNVRCSVHIILHGSHIFSSHSVSICQTELCIHT